ncbi:MAG TPA: glycosyltransferase family 1 protein [bacterium]|nr:glycosyltransferase family 1 protein [bacterium]
MKPVRVMMLRKSSGYYGAEHVILSLTRQLHAFGNEIIIGNIDDRRSPSSEFSEAARGINIPFINFPCSRRWDSRTIQSLSQTLVHEKIQILHTHGFKADLYGLAVSKKTGIPVVATKHGWTHAGIPVIIWEALDLLALRKLHHVIGVSRPIVRSLQRTGMRPDRLTWIPNGVKPHEETPLTAVQKEIRKWGRGRLVGTVGRLSPEKGHDILIEAFGFVQSVFPDSRCVILGDGPLRQNLEKTCRKRGLDQSVRFMGYQHAVSGWYSIFDVFVLPSRREGWPVTLLEAMAAGLPIAATRVGDIPFMLHHGSSGLLTEPEDSKSLSRAIIEIMNNLTLRHRLGLEAKKISRLYSEQRCASRVLEVYKSLLEA